ncbi:unnamed protein product, partial [Mesorhabditis belari]|uniref:SnoaL-like domain-containing protein n=1 Tax=Mesorhabditis belari TaxID=2138241 RepID=A0AAF3EPU6_9BILA
MTLEATLRPTLQAMWGKGCPSQNKEEGKEPDFSHILSFYDPNALEINVKEKKIYRGHEEITELFKEWMSCGSNWQCKTADESFTGGEDLIRYAFEMTLHVNEETKMVIDKTQYWKKHGDKYLMEVDYYVIKTANI